MPKFIHPLIQTRFNIDSFAFVHPREKKDIYVICDRENDYKNEIPLLHASLIKEGKKYGTDIERDYQFRLALEGQVHIEELNRWEIDPTKWRDRGWILLSEKSLHELLKIIQKALAFMEFEK